MYVVYKVCKGIKTEVAATADQYEAAKIFETCRIKETGPYCYIVEEVK